MRGDLRQILDNVRAFQTEIAAMPELQRAKIQHLKRELARALLGLEAEDATEADEALLDVLAGDPDLGRSGNV